MRLDRHATRPEKVQVTKSIVVAGGQLAAYGAAERHPGRWFEMVQQRVE